MCAQALAQHDSRERRHQEFRLLTLSSLIFSTLVRKSSSRLVQASLWLSEVRAKKYATASLHTLDKEKNKERNISEIYIYILGGH